MKTIDAVKNFWEENPLFSGESKFEAGTKEFFEEHRRVCIEDGLIGKYYKHGFFLQKDLSPDAKILDLGCGNGFWTFAYLNDGQYKNVYSGDLTEKALRLTKKRLDYYGLKANLSIQNAEKMTYTDEFFDHVNCQGVIHHTPDTESAVSEIARVLKKGRTAYISVYYRNILLRIWPKIFTIGRILHKFGGGMKGRGRESIFLKKESDEIVKLYDGEKNPVGKCYTKKEIIKMVTPYFEIEKMFLYFFPARVLPFKLPKFIHRFLADNFGFMIHLNLRKR